MFRVPAIRIVAIALITTIATACSSYPLDSGSVGTTTVHTMTVARQQRHFRVHLPTRFQPTDRLPLVIVLHGHDDDAEHFENSTGMSDKADAEHFVAVYPQALGDPAVWHTGVDGPSDEDDVRFITNIIRTMKRVYHVDRRRIYVAGHSNGGIMAYRIASSIPDDIAAVGTTAATIGSINHRGDTLRMTTPHVPVSVIHFHGMADPSMPYDGGKEADGPANIISAHNTILFWVKANHCQTTPSSRTISSNKNVIVDTYEPCANHSAVEFYTIVDGQHRWPGDDIPWYTFPNPEITDVDATDAMWSFFRTHPRR